MYILIDNVNVLIDLRELRQNYILKKISYFFLVFYLDQLNWIQARDGT